MEQGKALVVDLYYGSPGQIFVNVLLLNSLIFFVSVIISHYPIYLKQFFFESPDQYTWKIRDNTISYLGIITYSYAGGFEEKASNKIRYIGIFPFIAWLFILLDTATHYHGMAVVDICPEVQYPTLPAFIKLFLTTIFIFAVILFSKQTKKSFLEKKLVGKYVELSFVSSMLFLILLVISAINGQWNLITILLQIALTLSMLVFFIYFRANRFSLRYMSFYGTKFLGRFSSYYNYISSFRFFGICVALVLLAVNVSTSWAEKVNTINILMITLTTMYTIIVLWIKHWTFYNYRQHIDNNVTESPKPIYMFLYPFKWSAKNIARFLGISAMACVLLFMVSSFVGNDLHLLKLVLYKKIPIDAPRYLMDYKQQKHYREDSTIYYYSCFGGGLKAHAWNLLIQEKFRQKDVHAYKKFISLSGVSGGGMALANYAWISQFDSTSRKNMIEKICLSDITSIELSYLFGHDFIRELIPGNVWGYDRSNRVMNWYDDIIQGKDQLVHGKAFTTVWNEIYHKNGFYPNLILNSTSTTQKYGIVSPIQVDNIFPGSINLLSLYEGKYTLGYLEAASTCNRFPIVSPAARVKGKGHFVDGGYFENSGILSTLSFKNNFVKKDPELSKSKHILISVANDKIKYIHKLIADSIRRNVRVDEKNSAELGAILNTISDTDILPNYFREKIEYEKEFDSIIYLYMPYPITQKDLMDYFGGEFISSKADICALINQSNEKIINILREYPGYNLDAWGVVYPPLSRNIGYPAYMYMKAMLAKHPDFEILRK